MSQYFNIRAVNEEILRIPQAGPESIVYGVWNTILTWQFPAREGYTTRPQDVHTSQAGQRGYSDLHTYQYHPGQANADKFLIVQCKRAGHQNRESVWTQGIAQLNRYLSRTHGTRPMGIRTPVYGIVAVGRAMRLYKYKDASQTVKEWGPSSIGRAPRVGRGRYWDIDGDHRIVQRLLNYVKSHH